MKQEPTTFEVHCGYGGDSLRGYAARVVNHADGWCWVRYAGKRYQLLGGIRRAPFINLENPLKSNK